MKKSLYIFTALFTTAAIAIIAICIYCFSGCTAKRGDNENEVGEVTALNDETEIDVQPDDNTPEPDDGATEDHEHHGRHRAKGMPEVIRDRNGIAVGYHGNSHGGEFFFISFGDCHHCKKHCEDKENCEDCEDEKTDETQPDETLPDTGRSAAPNKNTASHRLPRRIIPAPVEP